MKTDWQDILQLLLNATGETLYMVLLAGWFTLLIGLPLGVLLFISRRGGLLPLPRVNRVLGGVINLGRSLPFVVMLIALIPLTRLIVGTTWAARRRWCRSPSARFRFLRGLSRPRWMKWTRAASKPSWPWAAISGM